MDNRKIILLFYVACSAIAWWLTRAIVVFSTSTWRSFFRNVPALNTWREALPLVAAVTCFFILFKHPKVNAYLDDVVSELKKVTWPSRQDVIRGTLVVLVFVVISSMLLGVFDVLWGKLIGSLLDLGKPATT